MTTAFFVGADLGPTQDIYASWQRLLKKGVTFTPDFDVLEIRGTEVMASTSIPIESQVFSDFDTRRRCHGQ